MSIASTTFLPIYEIVTKEPQKPKFRGSADKIQTIKDHQWMLAGPAETGKTYAGLYRLDHDLRTYPGSKAAIIRKVRADMDSTVLDTWRTITNIHRQAQPFGGRKPEWYDYPNGSICYVVGLDRAGKVLSGEFTNFYVNQAEEITYDDWAYLTKRSTGRGFENIPTWVGGDCNPGPPTSWVINNKNFEICPSYHVDNPKLYDDNGNLTKQGKKTIAILENLPGILRDRYYLGLWVSAEDIIFDIWDESKYVIDPFPIFHQWPKYRIHDFGYVSPNHVYCCQWWAEIPAMQRPQGFDRIGPYYVMYRELYDGNETYDVQAQRIVQESSNETFLNDWADHDKEGIATLRKNGIPAVEATKLDTKSQMLLIYQALKDGKVFFFRNARFHPADPLCLQKHLPTHTLEEFPIQQWKQNRDGEVTKEEPWGKHDHGVKNIAYFLASVGQSPSGNRQIETGSQFI